MKLEMERVYIIVRNDLTPGLQMAQAAHVITVFGAAFGEVPDNVVCLQVPNEAALLELVEKSQACGYAGVCFREPDLDGALTAIALEGSAKKLVSSLPLALRAAA